MIYFIPYRQNQVHQRCNTNASGDESNEQVHISHPEKR